MFLISSGIKLVLYPKRDNFFVVLTTPLTTALPSDQQEQILLSSSLFPLKMETEQVSYS